MNVRIILSALSKLLAGLLTVSLLTFLPAGTVAYSGALILVFVVFLPMTVLGIYLAVKNPSLLEKRLRTGEKQTEQKGVVLASAIMFIVGFVTAGLCKRFDFLMLPIWISVLFAGIFLVGYAMLAAVMLQNEYLSRVVEVTDGQRVIDTGLYGIVRHPMYLATLIMFLSMPLILGSPISLAVFCIYPFIIARRIRYEEILLEAELPGYTQYKQRVKYKLIPKIY